jgi:single-strand DNA-binding protein
MFHKVILVGNLGRDPEMRYTPGGQPVTSFSVASNRRYTDSGGQSVEETIWFRISVWGKQAEACKQYLSKGRQVLVEGRLVCDRQTGGPRTYKRSNGEMGTSFEINAEVVRFLGQRGDAQAAPAEPGTASAATSEEEIPF